MTREEFETSIAEYRQHDRAAERASDLLMEAYAKERTSRGERRANQFLELIAAVRAGDDGRSLATLLVRGLLDDGEAPDTHELRQWLHSIVCGYSNGHFRRLGSPAEWKVEP